VQFNFTEVPAGEAGTDQTLKVIGQGIGRSSRRPHVRLKALDILRRTDIPDRGARDTARALYQWVRRNIRFVPDPLDVETVQDPEVTLRIGAGDCDDHAALLAALAQNVGIPARFVVVGENPDHFQHIYAELLIDDRWTPADTTTKFPFGVSPPLPASKVYSMKGDPEMRASLSGPARAIPVSVEVVKRAAYMSAMNTLNDGWRRGKIDRSDLLSSLRVIDEGSAPSRGTVVEVPMRKAVEDFLRAVNQSGACSPKRSGQLSGLEGFGDFMASLYNNVKQGVQSVVKYGQQVFGGGAGDMGTYQIKPTLEIPAGLIQPQVSPQAAAAGVGAILSSPVFIGLAVIGVSLLISKKRGK